MSTNFIIFLIIFVLLIVLFIIALKKKWIGSASGGIFTSQVIIENQEDLDKRKGDSGEGPAGGKYLDEQ